MRVECSCGKSFNVKDELAGKRVRCPGCGETMVVEEVDDEELPAARSRKTGNGKKPKSRGKKKGGQFPWVIVGGTAAAAAVLIAGIVGVLMFTRGGGAAPAQNQVAGAGPAGDPKAGGAAPAAGTAPPAAATPERLGELKDVEVLAVSADGKMLATFVVRFDSVAKKDVSALHLWDAATGARIKTINHTGQTDFLRFSPTGRWLAASGPQAQGKLWSIDEAESKVVMEFFDQRAEFPPDESRAYLWRTNRGLSVFEMRTQQVAAELAKGLKFPSSLGICPEKNVAAILISAVPLGTYGPPTIAIYNLQSFEETDKYVTPGNGAPHQLVIAKNGKQMACISQVESALILGVIDIVAKTKWKELPLDGRESKRSLSISDDGEVIAANVGGKLTIWHPAQDKNVASKLAGVRALEFLPGSHDLYVCNDAGVQILNADSDQTRAVGQAAAQ